MKDKFLSPDHILDCINLIKDLKKWTKKRRKDWKDNEMSILLMYYGMSIAFKNCPSKQSAIELISYCLNQCDWYNDPP